MEDGGEKDQKTEMDIFVGFSPEQKRKIREGIKETVGEKLTLLKNMIEREAKIKEYIINRILKYDNKLERETLNSMKLEDVLSYDDGVIDEKLKVNVLTEEPKEEKEEALVEGEVGELAKEVQEKDVLAGAKAREEVFNLIKENPQQFRVKEIAIKTGKSQPRISEIVRELMELKMLKRLKDGTFIII